MRARSLLVLLAALLAVGCASPAPAPTPAPPTTTTTREQRAEAAAQTLIGTTPPAWEPELWINSPPLTLADLRGKVVLVRWWTAGCPFCSASAPALRTLDTRYRARGLTVVGMYHHKDEGPFDPVVYRETAKKYGFDFPLAYDPEWRTFKRWMRDAETGYTSVTFVLDRKGVVRHVHPGGQYVAGDAAYDKLLAVVDALIAEG